MHLFMSLQATGRCKLLPAILVNTPLNVHVLEYSAYFMFKSNLFKYGCLNMKKVFSYENILILKKFYFWYKLCYTSGTRNVMHNITMNITQMNHEMRWNGSEIKEMCSVST